MTISQPGVDAGEGAGCRNAVGRGVPGRLFLVHIPKTGGTTFCSFLESNYAEQHIINAQRFEKLRSCSGQREKFIGLLAEVQLITKQHLDFSYAKSLQAVHADMRLATILRLPVDRAISSIEHWCRVPEESIAGHDPGRRELLRDARSLPLPDLVEKHQRWLSNRQAKMLAGEQECSPLNSDDLKATALKNLEQIDYVGATDQMLPFAAAVAHFMGFFNSMNAHRLNVGRGASRLSAEQRQSIRSQLVELNQVDAVIYQEAELRCEQLLHRWKKALFDLTTPLVSRRLSAGETAVYSMKEPLVGDGWHEREGGIQTACRWAGPQRCSALYLALVPEGSFQVSIWMPSVISGEVLAGMAVRVGGVLVNHELTARDGFQVASATVSLADTEALWLHLELAFPRTASAWDICGAADCRQKTVAVERVEVCRLA